MNAEQTDNKDLSKWIPAEILEKFEVFNYNHAAEILSQSFANELAEIVDTLDGLTISEDDILKAGGNESPIPPKFSRILDPKGWKEIRISGDLLIKFFPRQGRKGVFSETPSDRKTIPNYIDGHNIDFVKGRIAMDVEWNSKDQTFDRDLFAMRTYYECDIISVGIIVTRSESLNRVFRKLGIMPKYGASTTWMGKLLPRLDSRRHGGCPILAIGITPRCIVEADHEK
ncbi:MAG: restriction endonuclease [Lentisphaeria bacterium]|nr:restriction endonuclease [Lentisphaeria bacterium]